MELLLVYYDIILYLTVTVDDVVVDTQVVRVVVGVESIVSGRKKDARNLMKNTYMYIPGI